MTEADFIDELLEREGGYTDDPLDRGHATNFGITAGAWGEYRRFGRPATRAEVQGITRTQAVAFYTIAHLTNSPFQRVAYEPLRVQLIDFGINSGKDRAIRWLQRVLDVQVTGRIDDRTVGCLTRDRGPLVNKALVAARLYMFDRIVATDPSQARFLNGWRTRALLFLDVTV